MKTLGRRRETSASDLSQAQRLPTWDLYVILGAIANNSIRKIVFKPTVLGRGQLRLGGGYFIELPSDIERHSDGYCKQT